MAKLKPAIITISGKVGNDIMVDSPTYGRYIRKAIQPGSKKEQPALKRQFSRTKFLNALASELNNVIRFYSGNLKRPDFYQVLLSRFRKEPLDNRFLLLLQLKGLEVSSTHTFSKLGSCTVTVKSSNNTIDVTLQVQSHPEKGKYKANCYSYEVILLSWDKSKKPATHSKQASEWIYLNDGRGEFEFPFHKPVGARHWLLCLRQRLGLNKMAIDVLETDGMQIVDVGTFDKKEELLLSKRNAEEMEKQTSEPDNVVEDAVRVKAKRIL